MSQARTDEQAALPPRSFSLTVLVVLATLGTLLGLLAHGNRHVPGDIALLEAIQRVDAPGIPELVRVSNEAFDTGGALVLGLIFMGLALLLHRSQLVPQLVVVIVLRVISQVLKPLFGSPRPSVEYQPDPSLVSSTFGYPSGHASTATVISIMVVIFVLTFDVPRWTQWATIAIAALVTAIAMFSRIWIGAHWPSDTIGGVMFGAATVALMQLVVGSLSWGRSGQRQTA